MPISIQNVRLENERQKFGAVLAILAIAILNFMMGCEPAHNEHVTRTISIANVVDLTHTLTPDFPYIPVPGITYPFAMKPIATLEVDHVAANEWRIHEHLGTQIDAPNHFIATGMSLEQLPLKSLIVPAAVIDIRERARKNPDTELTVDDILAWEKKHGPLPENVCVFMYSGWETRIGDPKTYLNMDSTNTMHFPGISLKAAEFLIEERDLAGVGVDVISFDPGWDKQYRTHKAILGAGKWAVEAVANLGQIPPSGATVFVGATKVGGATGGPVRLIAVW
jgi:kynurenine formamidase